MCKEDYYADSLLLPPLLGQRWERLIKILFRNEQLGIHKLTNEEKQEMVAYRSDGDIGIQAICENCHDPYVENPDCISMTI